MRRKADGELKVLKVYRIGDDDKRKQLTRLLSIALTRLSHHPHIVRVEGWFMDYSHAEELRAVVQFPFCERGTVTQFLSTFNTPEVPLLPYHHHVSRGHLVE